MREMALFPNQWQGQVPREILSGGQIQPSVFTSLAYLQHLCFPAWRDLSQLRVLDAGCGTGESVLLQALAHPAASFSATDPYPEALEIARGYAETLGLSRLDWLDPGVFFATEENGGESDGQPFDLIVMSRPLQHFGDSLPSLWRRARQRLAPDGALLVFALNEGEKRNREDENPVQDLEAGKLDPPQAISIFRDWAADAMELPTSLAALLAEMDKEGFRLLSGLPPANYRPESYLPDFARELGLFDWASPWEKAVCAERLSKGMGRHMFLFTRKEHLPLFPKIDSEGPASPAIIPFRSPFSGIGRNGDRYVLGLHHRFLGLVDGVEFEDLNVPERYAKLFSEIDGKKDMALLHHWASPMGLEEFHEVMKAFCEVELVFLHTNEVKEC